MHRPFGEKRGPCHCHLRFNHDIIIIIIVIANIIILTNLYCKQGRVLVTVMLRQRELGLVSVVVLSCCALL